jgi:TatD DNase family protein
MRYFDTHAHISGTIEEAEELLKRAHTEGVSSLMEVCVDEPTLELGILLKERKEPPRIFLSAATCPHDVAKEGNSFFPVVEKNRHLLDAIGETGLDYYYSYSPQEVQKEYFVKYLRLAMEVDLPVIIHCREAFPDLFSLYDFERGGKPRQDIMHCFTGTIDEAKSALDRGFFISFSGIITFPKAPAVREALEYVPLDRLLIETDSPYLAPVPHRGKKNEPSFLPLVAKVAAQIKGCSEEELTEALFKNGELAFAR